VACIVWNSDNTAWAYVLCQKDPVADILEELQRIEDGLETP